MKPMPYGTLRKVMMKAMGDASFKGRKAPARPERLDRRLPGANAAKLRKLGAPTSKNWMKVSAIYDAVITSILKELEAIDRERDWYELLSPARRTVILACNLEAEVNNGGFDQFYVNSSGDGAAATPGALRALGLAKLAAMVEKGNGVFKGGPPVSREVRLAKMDRLTEKARRVWSRLDDQFFSLDLPRGGIMGASVRLIRENEGEFFKVG